MIAIVCAFYQEAEHLISSLHLKADSIRAGQRCYEDNDREVMLMITGIGRLNAAASAAVLLSSGTFDHMIVFGSCAGLKKQKTGTLYLVHKVTDLNSGRSYYPDMENVTDYPEESLLTGDYPFGSYPVKRDIPLPYDINSYISDSSLHEYGIYDMECSGYLFAAAKYLRSDQIHVFKVISDHGETPETEYFTKIMQCASDAVMPYLQKLKSDINRSTPVETNDVASLFCCSFTMQQQLNQFIRYADAAGTDWRKIIDAFKSEGLLPCSDRESGKRMLYEFGKIITV